MKHGNYKEYNKHSSKLYIYSREDDTQKILVVCSFSDKSENWKVPAGFDMNTAQLILCNYKDTNTSTLKPYEAAVYRWTK